MAERDVKKLLFLHIEKIAVVAVLVIIVVYLFSLVMRPSEAEQLRSDTDKAIKSINKFSENPNLPEPLDVTYTKDLKEGFESVPPEGRKPKWFAYKRPYVVRIAEFKYPEQPVHDPPTLEAKEGIGEVNLWWRDSEDNQFVEIIEYILRRKEGANGVWEKLKEFDPETGKFVDRTVRPDTQYFYKLTSVAEAEDVPGFTDQEQESEEVEVSIPFNLEFGKRGIITSGDGSGASDFVIVEVIYHVRKDKALKERRKLERGTPIIVKDQDTGWKLQWFKLEKPAPGKEELIIKIKSQDGTRTKEFKIQIR